MAYPSTLVAGRCYFWPRYFDTDLTVPSIETLIYVDQGHDMEGQPVWIFRNPALEDETDETSLVAVTEKQLADVHDLGGLRLWLEGVERVLAPYPAPGPVAGLDGELFDSLDSAIQAFVDEPAAVSLTISGTFMPAGLTVERSSTGDLQFEVFVNVGSEPDMEARTNALMAECGATLLETRVMDRGRWRHVSFAPPAAATPVAEIVRRFLVGVHRIRAEDRLHYHYLAAGGRRLDIEPH